MLICKNYSRFRLSSQVNFNETDHDEKAGAITLKWSYNDIRATHSNVKANLGLRAHMSSTNDAITDAATSTSSRKC